MDVANLQLEGVLMAFASINKALVDKGILTVGEIDKALARAEANLTGEERVNETMSPSNRDAVCFPIRVLRLANDGGANERPPSFADLARGVGQAKRLYNDQM